MPAIDLAPASTRPDLIGATVRAGLDAIPDANAVRVAAIDPTLSDTAAFCEAYDVPLAGAANCIVVAGKRGGEVTYAACVVLATTRLDVNGVVRRALDARSASFAPMDDAVQATGMEYGAITPIGLPADWRLLIDARVADAASVIVGAGLRAAKLAVPGSVLAALPNAEVVDGLAGPRPE